MGVGISVRIMTVGIKAAGFVREGERKGRGFECGKKRGGRRKENFPWWNGIRLLVVSCQVGNIRTGRTYITLEYITRRRTNAGGVACITDAVVINILAELFMAETFSLTCCCRYCSIRP